MASIVWDDKFKTGNSKIDNEHRKLIDLINQLSGAMQAGKGKEVCGKVLGDLITYTKTHFAMEEQLMATHSYAKTTEHKAEHAKLVQEVLDFQTKFNAGAVTLSVSLFTFLKDWLVNHIMKSDMALAHGIAK